MTGDGSDNFGMEAPAPVTSVTEVDLGSLELDSSFIEEGPSRPVERTRALLAYLLFGLLAGIITVLLLLLALRRITPEQFGTIAGVLLAPVVGLLGAATGYYYGMSNR